MNDTNRDDAVSAALRRLQEDDRALSAAPSVEARLRSFDDSIHKMLWPEDRDKDSLLGAKLPGIIDRVGDRPPPGHGDQPVYLKVSRGYLPDFVAATLSAQSKLFPSLFTEDGLRIGPIPKGTPIGPNDIGSKSPSGAVTGWSRRSVLGIGVPSIHLARRWRWNPLPTGLRANHAC